MAYGLVANVIFDQPITGLLSYQSKVLRPLPPGDSLEYRIPIVCEKILHSGKSMASIKIQNRKGNYIQISEQSAKVITKSDPVPRLKIINHTFETFGKSIVDRDDTVKITVRVQNFGEIIANDVTSIFNYPYQVQPIGNLSNDLGSLLPGESKEVSLSFYAKQLYFYDTIAIQCTVFDLGIHSSDVERFNLGIRSYFDIKLPGGNRFQSIKPELWMENYRGPNPGLIYPQQLNEDIRIKWAFPKNSLDKIKGEKIASKLIPLKATINAKEKLCENDISILINGKHQKDYLKEIKLIATDQDQYKLFFELYLLKGKNNVTIKVSKGKAISEPLKVIYTAPILHIYSLGIPYEDLKYTVKDVRDICNAFMNQADGELYTEIIKERIDTTWNATNVNGLMEFRNAILDPKIAPEDRVLFIGSFHAKTEIKYSNFGKTSFRIQPSDLNGKSEVSSIAPLFPLLLKKLGGNKSFFIIDACYSGVVADISRMYNQKRDNYNSNARSIENETFENYINQNTSNRVYVLASAFPTNKSIELKYNGLFSRAIIKEFESKKFAACKEGKLPKVENLDNLLSIEELFSAIKETMEAISTGIGNYQPYMIPSQIDHTPFYFLKE